MEHSGWARRECWLRRIAQVRCVGVTVTKAQLPHPRRAVRGLLRQDARRVAAQVSERAVLCSVCFGKIAVMELGVHLPLMEFGDEGLSLARLQAVVDVARESRFAAVSANDHFVFSTPWLDGLTALAAVIERSGEMTLATTISLAALRGPVPLAKALAALDLLSGGRLVAGVGPGSSKRGYDALGVSFEDRWQRFDEAVIILRALLGGERPSDPTRHFALPDAPLTPAPCRAAGPPLWIGSWGSRAGLRRVARLGDGWLASAYNTSPDQFASA